MERKSAEKEPKESLHSGAEKVAEESVGRTEFPERGGQSAGFKVRASSRTELETGLRIRWLGLS